MGNQQPSGHPHPNPLTSTLEENVNQQSNFCAQIEDIRKVCAQFDHRHLSKVVLLGDNYVGKSCLVWRLNNLQVPWDEKGLIQATVGAAFMTKRLVIEDTVPFNLGIWDTAGSEKYDSMGEIYARGSAAAVIIYDVTEKRSYDIARSWVERIKTKNLCPRDVVVCLVGTKADSDNRAVSPDEVKSFAREKGILLHGEVSAKTGLKVAKLFTEVARAIITILLYKEKGKVLPDREGVFSSSFIQMDMQLKISAVNSKDGIPLEILLMGPGALNAYQKASQDGTQEIHRTRLMLVGQERVGKTSLMNSLIGKKHDSSESITDSLDATKICKVAFSNPSAPWKLQDINKKEHARLLQEQYKKIVASEMAKKLLELNVEVQTEHEEVNEDKKEAEEASSAINEEDEITIETKNEDDVMIPQTPSDEMATNEDLPDSSTEESSARAVDRMIDDNGQESVVPPDIVNALDKLDTEFFTDKETNDLEIAFWDFAGQELYYTTHQVFLNQRAVFALVFNMSQSLHERCQVEDFSRLQEKRKKKCCSRYHDLSGVEFINFWLQSVYTYAAAASAAKHPDSMPYKSPPIFIVGTHRGVNRKKVEAVKQDEDLVKQEILDSIAGKPYEEHIIRQIHFIENNPKLRNQEDQEAIQALKKQIAEVAMNEPYMKDKVPIRWLQFQKAVLEASANNKHYMTLTEARQLATSFKILDDIEFSTMLHLYHDLGTIIYFGGDETQQEKSLKDIVILDPQWLIDVFKRIITVLPGEKQWATYSAMWRRLQDEGILEDALIDHVWKDLHHLKPQLLELMEMFDLLFLTSTEGDEQKPTYYVPGCLQPPTMQANQRSQDITDGTFYVNCYDFLPDGIFHRVLVCIARWAWKTTGKSPKLYYRLGTFTVGPQDNIHTCQLQMRASKPACIKVTVKKPPVYGAASESKPSIEVCTEVLRFIEETMSNLKCKWAKGIQYEMSVCCMACKDRQGASRDAGLHLIPLMECYKAQFVHCELTDQQIPTKFYWEQLQPLNEESVPTTSITSSKREETHRGEATDSDIADVIGLLGPAELQLMYSALGILQRDIEKAEEGANTTNVNLKARAVMRWWKQVTGQKATRSVILDALQECQCIDAKEKLDSIWLEKYPGST